MKTKRVSIRNFIGGLLGGFLGILAFGYIHPIALPFGCLFGVVIGWWHQEIMQLNFKEIVSKANIVVTLNINMLTKKRHAPKWLGIYLAKISAITIFLGFWVVYSAILFTSGDLEDGLATLSTITACILILMAFITFLLWYSTEDTSGIKIELSKLWKEKAKKNSFVLFARETINIFRIQLFVFMVALCLAAFVAPLFGYFLLIIVPMTAFILTVKAVDNLLGDSGHKLCLVVTLVITALTAFLARNAIADGNVIWYVAIMAGFGSASITEIIRLTWLRMFSTKHFIREASTCNWQKIAKNKLKNIADILEKKIFYLTEELLPCICLEERQ